MRKVLIRYKVVKCSTSLLVRVIQIKATIKDFFASTSCIYRMVFYGSYNYKIIFYLCNYKSKITNTDFSRCGQFGTLIHY